MGPQALKVNFSNMCVTIGKFVGDPPKFGYKVVNTDKLGKYYGMISNYPFSKGKAPELADYLVYEGPMMMNGSRNRLCLKDQVNFNGDHIGAYSFFRNKADAFREAGPNRVVLKCEVRSVTFRATWKEDDDLFLAEEVVSYKRVRRYGKPFTPMSASV